MKNINLMVCLILYLSTVTAQQIPQNKDGLYEYTEVVNAEETTKEKLYANAETFVFNSFRSAKDVVQLDDTDAKNISGIGTFRVHFSGLNSLMEYYVRFRFVIQCKDNRYRYFLNHFELADGSASCPLEDEKKIKHFATKNMRSQIFAQTEAQSRELINSLKAHMNSNTQPTDDNW